MQVYMGGIVPTSLVNWKKSSCLEICLAGCDFKCPYCNKTEFLEFKEEFLIDLLEVKRQLNSYAGHIEAVLFSGGEPGLQRQALVNLARHSKHIGFDVGISTNGARPSSVLSLLREDLLDFIELDIKTSFDEALFEKATRSKTFFKQTKEIIESIKETLEILKKYQDKIKVFFKTTYIKGLIDDENYFFEIAEMIKDFNAVWTIQNFNMDNVRGNFDLADISELIVLKEKINLKYPMINVELG